MTEPIGLLLGTAQLAQPYGVVARPREFELDAQIGLIRLAETHGLAAIDTSPVYGGAERVIGDSRTSMAVHTKCHPNLSVEDSVRNSKLSLQRETLDVVYLHESLDGESKSKARLQDLARHVGNGIGAIGASVYEVDEFANAVDASEVSIIQTPINILDRRFADTDLLSRAADAGKKVIARSVFLQGLLVADESALPPKFAALRPYLERVSSVAQQNNISKTCLALSYVRQLHGISGIIVGVSSKSELELIVNEFSGSATRTALDLHNSIESAPWDLVDPRRW